MTRNATTLTTPANITSATKTTCSRATTPLLPLNAMLRPQEIDDEEQKSIGLVDKVILAAMSPKWLKFYRFDSQFLLRSPSILLFPTHLANWSVSTSRAEPRAEV